MAENNKILALDKNHAGECHSRWIERMSRDWSDKEEEDVPAEWTTNQCGGCMYYIPLQGVLKSDWGVCSNQYAASDGRVMFEHDGCDFYAGANEWIEDHLAVSDANKGEIV